MINKAHIILIIVFCGVTTSFAQKSAERFFGGPILTDTTSTLFIPTRYDQTFLSSNKIAFWNDIYANIIVYNFKTDSYKMLFEHDTYIASLTEYRWYNGREDQKNESITPHWIFLKVKTTDTNKNGRIDDRDPSLLFAASANGQELKQLTQPTENVVDVDAFPKQGFILIKLQRDSDHDGSFRHEDDDYYFRKISLTDLSIGKPVEIR